MPNCTSCGRESPVGYKFCLNCGSKLELAPALQTPAAAQPLPAVCPHCGTHNLPGMKFCQNCGRASSPVQIPYAPTPMMAPAPMPANPHTPLPRPNPVTPAPRVGPSHITGPSPASLVPGAASGAPERACPHCGGQTPLGLRFCQRCGAGLVQDGEAPPVAQPRSKDAFGTGPTAPPLDSGATVRSARWGTLVCLNRDGSQGAEYPLAGEFIDVGRDGQIRFDDHFLAPRHLRLEREGHTVNAIPLDRTNGSFLRLTEQVKLESTTMLLLGRELLRFELLDADERAVGQAIQHGVKLFGSPVREAWGRLHQLLPDGCSRDIRHLIGAEVIIGREEGDVVFADDEFLSRRHASLHWRDATCYLQDLGSSNGSFIRLTRRTPLATGAQLRFGDQMVRIDLEA